MTHPDSVPAVVAFDRLASGYQRNCDNEIFSWMRQRVHTRWSDLAGPGVRVLEIGCGIGIDSCFLASRGATVVSVDPAPAMVASTRDRASAGGYGTAIRVLEAGLESLPALLRSEPMPPFDMIVSNFGALNCVGDLSPLRDVAAQHLRPGGMLSLGLMTRYCAWEMAYYVARGRPKEALRRMGPSPRMVEVEGIPVPTWYHRAGDVIGALGSGYRIAGLRGLAVFVPPPWLAHGWSRLPAGLRGVARAADERLAHRWPCNRLGDHYLLEVAGP